MRIFGGEGGECGGGGGVVLGVEWKSWGGGRGGWSVRIFGGVRREGGRERGV